MTTQVREDIQTFIAKAAPFLEYAKKWEEGRPVRRLEEIVKEAGGPEYVAIISVDLIKGFCTEGPLASPRVQSLVAPVTLLLQRSHALGIREFVFTQDSHPKDSPEFSSFPPHCVEGTSEAEMVDEFKKLPFSHLFTIIPKKSINSAVGTTLDQWLSGHNHIRKIIAVGDCTDLCLFQLAMHLKLRANVDRLGYEVIVPEAMSQTYDLPVDVAKNIGAMAHDGDLLHLLFLYQMALNGVQVLKDIK
ncbi:MAG: cysteine hydrolase [Armatimonadetes bacterium]|nr:cysteine hydrolase [Armatimonadota bacterium]